MGQRCLPGNPVKLRAGCWPSGGHAGQSSPRSIAESRSPGFFDVAAVDVGPPSPAGFTELSCMPGLPCGRNHCHSAGSPPSAGHVLCSIFNWKFLATGARKHSLCMCVCACVWLSCTLFMSPWTVTCQASLSLGFSRQEYWGRLSFSSPGSLPHLRIEPASPASQVDYLPQCAFSLAVSSSKHNVFN